MWLSDDELLEIPDPKQFLKMRDLMQAHGWHRCTHRRAYWVGDPNDTTPHDDNIYRVIVDNTTGHVKVSCIGLESVDAIVDGNYDSVQDLPDWMQEKLTLLSMLSHTPPTEPVAGVGRRINAEVYWVFC
jgi:hypothetical protein